MKHKQEARKKRIKKETLMADENASLSSELNDDEEIALEREIIEKLRREHELIDDESIDKITPGSNDADAEQIESNLDLNEKENFRALDSKIARIYESIEDSILGNNKITNGLALAILFYFYKRIAEENVQSHPVIKRITQLEDLLKSKRQKSPEQNQLVSDANEATEKQTVNKDDKPRLITTDMYRNRGIPTLRSLKKQKMNPRLKQKAKYKKAQTKMRSKGLLKKGIDNSNKYSGERTGIKTGVNRALTIG